MLAQVLSLGWGAILARGLLSVFFGLALLAMPGLTLTALIFTYGAYAIVDGIFSLVQAIRNARQDLEWGWQLFFSLISLAAGVFTFVYPLTTAVAILYLIAAWSVIKGILEIVMAIQLRKEIKGEWMLVLAGLCSLVFGAVVAAYPVAGLFAAAWMIGVFVIANGFFNISLAFRLRRFLAEKPVFPSVAAPFPPTRRVG